MSRNDLKNGHLIYFPSKLNVKQRKEDTSVTKNSALYRNRIKIASSDQLTII